MSKPSAVSVGVLVPIDPGRPVLPPEARPVGRAALDLAAEGIVAVFGDVLVEGRMSGLIARPGGWAVVRDHAVVALHDRYPSQRRAGRFAEIIAHSQGLPLGNPQAITLLCRDKLACQRYLEGAGEILPEVEADPRRFAERLAHWGKAFIKPRYGALGVGVRRVERGDPLPDQVPGVVGVPEPAILQRAVEPPSGWAGRCVRVLCQREPDGGWVVNPAVLRQSRTDPVVNVARGAEALPAQVGLSPEICQRMRTLCARICAAIAAHPSGALALELGIDLVIDHADRPQLIEVNSRPRGRLEALAVLDPQRYGALHRAACARPIRTLARRALRSG